MYRGLLITLLCATAVAAAHGFVCNDRVKPGQVQNIRLSNTGFYNGYSSMSFAWDRPNDPTIGGKSCIKSYDVGIYRMDGQRIQSARVDVTLDAAGGTYQAKGLTAGAQYKISVEAVGPSQGNGAPSGQRGPFTAAPANVCDDNKKPGQVSSGNVRLMATATDMSTYGSKINWEWDRPNDKDSGLVSCINQYEVAVYNSEGRQFVSALVDVDLAHTKAAYEAKGLQPGSKYYISVTGKSPKQGMGAPGVKAGPYTAAGNPTGGSVQPKTADEKGK